MITNIPIYPMSQSIFMNSEKRLNILTAFIASLALAVAIWQGIETRKHNRLSVAPYITVAPMLTGLNGLNGIYIANDGTGTAFIKKASLTVNGKQFDLTTNSWPQVYEHLGIKPLCHSESWFKEGAALKAGEERQIISLTKNPLSASCPFELIKLLSTKELNLSIEYYSIYKEKFFYKGRIGLDRQEVNTYNKLFTNK